MAHQWPHVEIKPTWINYMNQYLNKPAHTPPETLATWDHKSPVSSNISSYIWDHLKRLVKPVPPPWHESYLLFSENQVLPVAGPHLRSASKEKRQQNIDESLWAKVHSLFMFKSRFSSFLSSISFNPHKVTRRKQSFRLKPWCHHRHDQVIKKWFLA